MKRLHQVPRRAVDARLVARVDVLLRPAAPELTARGQLELDDALGAERDRDAAVGLLLGRGHEDARAARQGGLDLRPSDDLGKVRRADLLFPFGHEHEVDRGLHARAAEGVERRQERGLRTLLVDGAAADDDFSEPGLVDDRGLPRR